jgi:hypothetical protein
MHRPEVKTRSVPTAAYLTLAGHDIAEVLQYDDGPMFRFSRDAQPALERFLEQKQRIEALAGESAQKQRREALTAEYTRKQKAQAGTR